ncbi:MAG: aminomethyl-transferring glycine dehydrogenase subunit GcvPB [Steroidobacteraceae bacterium]
MFELSSDGRRGADLNRGAASERRAKELLGELCRDDIEGFPEVSEPQAMRHFLRLSQLNFAQALQFYPLGSCTMKYNPKACHALATLPPFLARHPLAPESRGQGVLACLYELQEMLKAVTGMEAVSLTPMAGAQGELAGVAMILAYHRSRGDHGRCEILVPEAAHGTNPATASMCGAAVREIPVAADGDVNLEALAAVVGPRTAGIMLTNPSTLGVFERRIVEVARTVHDAGGLLYYDGANLNAILGKVRPADMGFDVVHVNLHKTFSTPHGGGGPGAGAVGVGRLLEPFLPIPIVGGTAGRYRWLAERDRPSSIGRLSAFMGNTGVLLRAYVYMRLLGRDGMAAVAEHAALNANYLLARLVKAGFEAAYPTRRAGHELIITLKREARENEVTAMDFAKRLLDYGVHAPTTYFPLLVPECLLIEPTETESKESLDAFVEAMVSVEREAREDPERVRRAPHTLPVRRLDDVRAAKQLDLCWKPGP